MSRFFNPELTSLTPYIPGEQPQDRAFIKLNTNELPYPPPKGVINAVANAGEKLNLYCDSNFRSLKEKFSVYFDVGMENILFGNGSDEILDFCFGAFCLGGAAFADITYGFYEVYAQRHQLNSQIVPLREDFTIVPEDYAGIGKTIFIANPNAPTGIALNVREIENIVKWNPNNVVIIDEAYVDFGAVSCMQLTKKYPNLMVVGTFSKSRAMAGARLGYAVADRELIADINRIRCSINPYNVNSMTQLAGEASIADDYYFKKCIHKIMETRQDTIAAFREMGFICRESMSNFIFPSHPNFSGEELYLKLREKGILVRWFNKLRIDNYLRISIGTDKEMHELCLAMRDIIAEKQ